MPLSPRRLAPLTALVAFAILACPPPALAQKIKVLKTPMTATTPVDLPPTNKRFDYCKGTTGMPPNQKPIPLEWEVMFENPTSTAETGVRFNDQVQQGLNGNLLTLVCPPTKIPTGATVNCSAATNTLTITNITVPPCGRTTLRFQTIVDGTANNIDICNGADITDSVTTFRSQSPLGASQTPIDGTNTCFFVNGGCTQGRAFSARLYQTVTDINGPPLLPGDRVLFKATFDARNLTDFPGPTIAFDHYFENQSGDAILPLPADLDLDPTTLQNFVTGAIADYNATARTLQIIDDPVAPGTPTIPKGLLDDIVQFEATVNCAAPASIGICNTASIKIGSSGGFVVSDDPDTYDVQDATCAIPVQPNFANSAKAIADADTSGDAQRGELLTFTIDVPNSTTCPSRLMDCECRATNVTVVDLVDLTFLDPTSITVLQGGTRTGNQISWTLPAIPGDGRAGNPQTVQFTARVLNSVNDGDIICNTSVAVTSAELKSKTEPGGISNCPTVAPTRFGPVCITAKVPAVPLLTLDKQADRSPADYCPGDKVTYTVTVTNGGLGTASDVKVWDPIAAVWPSANINVLDGGSLCPGLPACPQRQVEWPTIATLPGSSSQSFRFEATIPTTQAPGIIQNFAQANATNPVKLIEALAPIMVQATSLTFVKALPAPLPTYRELDLVTWTITVTNTGNCPITNVRVTDNVDLTLLDNNTISCVGGSYASPTCTWPVIATLAPAQSQSFTMTGQILDLTAGRQVANTARLTYDQGSPVDSAPSPSTNPIVQPKSSGCTSPLPPVGNTTKAVKDGPSRDAVKLTWAQVNEAKDGYGVYHQPDKTLISQAKRGGTPAPTIPCTNVAQGPTPECIEPLAVPPTNGTKFYYQIRSQCGTSEDI